MTTTSLELCALTGLTYRQVDFWTRAGYLTPLHDPNPGSGHAREFDEHQVALAVQMARLTRAGLPANVAHRAAIDVTHFGQAQLGGYVLAPTHDAPFASPVLPENVHPINRTGGHAA